MSLSFFSVLALGGCSIGVQPMGTKGALEEEAATDADALDEEGGAASSSEDSDESSDSNDEDGDDPEDDDHSGFDSDEEDDQDDLEEDPSCDVDGFDVAIHQAIQDNQNIDQPLFFYQARTTDTAPFDELRILSYQADPYNGPTGPGTYDLSGSNYADCALCVLVIEECTDDYMCEKVYFASEGQLDVERLSMDGGPFIATLTGAVFEEVSIDEETYESRPVSGGDEWCVDDMVIELPIQVFEAE